MHRRAALSVAVVALLGSLLLACSPPDERSAVGPQVAPQDTESTSSSGSARAPRPAVRPAVAPRSVARREQGASIAGGERGIGLEPDSRAERARKTGPVVSDQEVAEGRAAEPVIAAEHRSSAAWEIIDEPDEVFPEDPGGDPDPATEPVVAEFSDPADVFRDDVDYFRQLESFDPVLRAEAAEMIEPVGGGLRALLRVAAEDPDPLVRVAAVLQLGEADSRAALRGLTGALSDEDPRVVLEAIDAIEFAAGPRVIPKLVPLLDHADREVRDAAEEAIDFLE